MDVKQTFGEHNDQMTFATLVAIERTWEIAWTSSHNISTMPIPNPVYQSKVDASIGQVFMGYPRFLDMSWLANSQL
jgi:hypothetical protein